MTHVHEHVSQLAAEMEAIAATPTHYRITMDMHRITDDQIGDVYVAVALELLEQWTEHLAHETPDRRYRIIAEAVENELAIAVHRHGFTGLGRSS